MSNVFDPPASPPQAREESYPAVSPYGPDEGRFINVYHSPDPLDGGMLAYRMYRTPREGGRRVTVVGPGGRLLFDTGDCYNAANATNSVDLWLTDRIKRRRIREQGENVLALAAVRQARPTDPSDALCVG